MKSDNIFLNLNLSDLSALPSSYLLIILMILEMKIIPKDCHLPIIL